MERGQGKVGVTGLIHVPDNRVFYLEQIQADLEENPRTKAALLDSLKQVHAETVGYLLNELMNIPKTTTYKNVKTTKELRDVFSQELVKIGLFDGYSSDYGNRDSCSAAYLHHILIGKLPLFMGGQNIDFLRDLDGVLKEDRELGPMRFLY